MRVSDSCICGGNFCGRNYRAGKLLIEKLESFGIISNEYDPSGYATRREMADIIAHYISLPSGSAPATVIDIYKMLDAASMAATVETLYYGDGDVQYTWSDSETFLSENYGIKKYRGMVTGNEHTKLTSYSSNLTDEQIEIDGVLYDTPGYIYGYFLGYTVDYYVF